LKILQHSIFRGLAGIPGGKPVHSVIISLPDMKAVAAFLRKGIYQYRHDPRVRRAAMDAIRENGAPEKNKLAQAVAIATWVKHHCYYIHEPDEVFQTPTALLRERAGDCDDFTWLQCSMMESVGIPSKMNLVRIGGLWKHIYPSMVVAREGRVVNVPLDATLEVSPAEFPRPDQIAREQGQGDVYIMVA
jgi:hypothetical protein